MFINNTYNIHYVDIYIFISKTIYRLRTLIKTQLNIDWVQPGSTGFWIQFCILAAMFKIDSRNNRLKQEICWQSQRNRKNKSITVNKHMFKVQNSNNYFEYVSLYLVKIVFITLELHRYFRIPITVIEDNPNSKMYGKHIWMQVFLICNLVL